MASNPSPVPLPFGNAAVARDQNFVPDIIDPTYAWSYGTINELLWNESLPYQLTFYERQQDGSFQRKPGLGVFTLPIPPTDLNRSTPAAIQVTPLLGGITEEHNGSPIRSLTFSGTTGVLPLRPGGAPTPPLPTATAIFAGTIQGVNGVVQNATKLINGPQSLFTANLVQDSDFNPSGTLAKSSGYYQFRLLEKFFDYYFFLKKQNTAKTQPIVLAIEIHKDEAIYLAALQDFAIHRTSSSPLEYTYSLAFKTWKKIVDTTRTSALAPALDATRDPNLLSTILTRITNARNTVESLNNVINGFAADANAVVFEPLRQVGLFAKDILNVSINCADLPSNLVVNMKSAIIQAMGAQGTIGQAATIFGSIPTLTKQAVQDAVNFIENFSVITSQSNTQSANLANTQNLLNSSANPANKILNNPQDNYSLFSQIQPSSLNLSPAVTAQIVQEQTRARLLTRLDFETMRNGIVGFSANYANSVGAGDSIYNDTFSLANNAVSRTPTLEDFAILDALNESVIQFNKLVASPDPQVVPDPLTYIAAAAAPFDIQVRTAQSKVAIPFPYGSTLEMVAARYLNDPQRWIEIATLNNLQEPYIDEVGFDLPLLVNASQNEVTVATAGNLYVGQSVSLVSTTQRRQNYIINAITPVGSTFILQLNTNGVNLSAFTTANLAQLHAFLPNTVNSQQIIYIPSDDAPDLIQVEGAPNSALANLTAQLQQGGADLLLTSDTNDLAITPDGDCKLAIGLANKIQRIRLVIQTPIGSLLEHPEYGFPISEGESLADLDAQSILKLTQNLFQDDPSFGGVEGVRVTINGPTINITFTVIDNVTGEKIPLSFDVAN